MLCSQAPKVHLLPMIATKGGRRQMGKVLACPIYKRMNIETAYDLSALAQEGGEREQRRRKSSRMNFRIHMLKIPPPFFWGNFEHVQNSPQSKGGISNI